MNPVEREPFLIALDQALSPLGFKRFQSSFEWKRRKDESNTQFIHLNFGLAGINPSFGTRLEDLVKLLPSSSGSVSQTIRMLTSITGVTYSEETLPSILVSDVLNAALPELDRLCDREGLLEALFSNDPVNWPTPSRSHRIRLLPLILASLGRYQEGLQWLSTFESSDGSVDQMLPRFHVFSEQFRSRFEGQFQG